MGVMWNFKRGQNYGKEWKFVRDGIVRKNTEFLERRKVQMNEYLGMELGIVGKNRLFWERVGRIMGENWKFWKRLEFRRGKQCLVREKIVLGEKRYCGREKESTLSVPSLRCPSVLALTPLICANRSPPPVPHPASLTRDTSLPPSGYLLSLYLRALLVVGLGSLFSHWE